mgnify:CR=1 FL=1
MSVVPMKLLTIAGPLERFDDVVRACVIDQEFHRKTPAAHAEREGPAAPWSWKTP